MAYYKDVDVIEAIYDALRTPPLKGVLTDTMSLAVAIAERMPTANVREVVHAKWIRSDWNGAHIRYTCSNCQLSVLSNEDYMRKHRFCFACGAIMDEVVE